jgi:hypothetical protein
MYDTQSFMRFLVCTLKVSAISGKGLSHFNELPKSPWVPIAIKYAHSWAISRSSSLQISYVVSAVVATGG